MKIKEGFYFVDNGANVSFVFEIINTYWEVSESPYKVEKTMWCKLLNSMGNPVVAPMFELEGVFNKATYIGKQ